jgi:RimJ/RimL family protein N-acetyltransferase
MNVGPLFEGMGYHLGLCAMLYGGVPGQLYVDIPEHPTAVLASLYQKRFFLAGLPENAAFIKELRSFFAKVVYPRARERHEPAFLVYYQPASWEERLGDIFQDAELIHAWWQYYECTDLERDRRASLPDGFELCSVDRALLARQDLENMDLLKEEMCSERASLENFLQNSFGVCVIDQDEIAGMCLSEYNYLDRCEVGILTVENYRRRGLATIMAHALIGHAFARGISQVGWHCFANNTPSVNTALKAGFVKQADYPACIVRIPSG